MKHPYLKTYSLLFAIILSGLLFIGFISYKNNVIYKETSKKLSNSHQVLFQAEHLLSFVKDLKARERGKYLTSDSTFVPGFLESKGIIKHYVDSIGKLTESNIGQSARINYLNTLIEKRLAIALQINALSKNSDANYLLIQRSILGGSVLLNSMEHVILEIQREENRLVKIRDNFFYENASSLNNRFMIFLFIAAFFVIGVYFIMKNDLKYRNEAERKINKLNENLEQRVKDKTKEIIEKETRYHWILDNMLEGIQIIDLNGKYTYVNEAWSRESGIPIENLLGSMMAENYPLKANKELFHLLRECIRNQTSHLLDHNISFADGRQGYYNFSIQPLPDGILVLSRDISERRKRELEKEKYINELQEILFKISHEVRHPIVQILGVSDLLLQQLISKEELDIMMTAMRQSALLLDSHTRDLTEFVYTMKNNSQLEHSEV